MKINARDIYNEFNHKYLGLQMSLKEELVNYEKSKAYLLDKLTPFQHYIDNFTNINFSKISTLDRTIYDGSYKHLVDVAGIDVNIIQRVINAVVEINKAIYKIQDSLVEIENSIIKYDTFKEILYKFNEKISDEIVYKGYILQIGSGLGHIRIKKINCLYNKDGSLRTKKRIDWNQSNIKRKEIEARGGVPFKVTKREGRTALEDNGGEAWFVYFNNEWDFLWHWYKGSCKVLNSPYYRFRPTIYNNTSRYGGLGNVNKLKQLVTSNSDLLANFTENMIDKGHRKGNVDNLWRGFNTKVNGL